MIKIKHNFEKEKFMWLWSKYVVGVNDEKHCTASLKGKYSKKFSKHNEEMVAGGEIEFDEQKDFKAIYICGVIKKGYSQKKNYIHNVHLVIIPKEGVKSSWKFDEWNVEIENGVISEIIDEDKLDGCYKNLEEKYTTCRIFRWAVSNKEKFKID
ncbi:hypothetical protein [uncultured Clostridium sp.]|uniref:hypothetical protein n=1 Tax=uncultured Clostridium sp. TaxID=59620 RepID=UPI00261B79EB|nr:hypothetical protein [uncultured Clostridium sp.]